MKTVLLAACLGAIVGLALQVLSPTWANYRMLLDSPPLSVLKHSLELAILFGAVAATNLGSEDPDPL